MKNLNKVNCVELTLLECGQINGGVDKSTSFWHDVAFIGGAIVQGLIVFGREGGRNAGLCVR